MNFSCPPSEGIMPMGSFTWRVKTFEFDFDSIVGEETATNIEYE